jgi:hypothetical protein
VCAGGLEAVEFLLSKGSNIGFDYEGASIFDFAEDLKPF